MHLCYITPININRTFLTGLLDLRSFQEVGQSRTRDWIKNDIDRILLVPVKNDFGEIQAYLLLTNVYDKGEINPVSLLQHLAPVFSKKLRDAALRIKQD